MFIYTNDQMKKEVKKAIIDHGMSQKEIADIM